MNFHYCRFRRPANNFTQETEWLILFIISASLPSPPNSIPNNCKAVLPIPRNSPTEQPYWSTHTAQPQTEGKRTAAILFQCWKKEIVSLASHLSQKLATTGSRFHEASIILHECYSFLPLYVMAHVRPRFPAFTWPSVSLGYRQSASFSATE